MELAWVTIFKVLLLFSYTLAKKVTIKWNITWNNAATIPTTTSTTTTKKSVNKGGLIGGIVGAIVGVIVAVVVSVIVVRKSKERRFRADAENAKDSKEKSNLAPQPVYTSDGAKKDKRNGNRHSLSKPQTQQKHKDDPIIYADLDLKSQPRALITKPSGDTPADSVLYTSIDHIKTRKLKDQLDEPSIPTTAPPPPPLYGNVTDN
ncbi:hypothetical protein EB796_014603 [Bugula neritina]|uniref:Uncharacterized protein n=1 Tax=Bugula neritina TaxID=10212 RepID=A0A7J7JM37_BUGNE|nr:hypothetical protein EB796_014603 [Bugula neritina]